MTAPGMTPALAMPTTRSGSWPLLATLTAGAAELTEDLQVGSRTSSGSSEAGLGAAFGATAWQPSDSRVEAAARIGDPACREGSRSAGGAARRAPGDGRGAARVLGGMGQEYGSARWRAWRQALRGGVSRTRGNSTQAGSRDFGNGIPVRSPRRCNTTRGAAAARRGRGERPASAEWLEYGRRLAELVRPGRLIEVDAGRAPALRRHRRRADRLILHLPDDPRVPASCSGCRATVPAQRATFELLVLREAGTDQPRAMLSRNSLLRLRAAHAVEQELHRLGRRHVATGSCAAGRRGSARPRRAAALPCACPTG